MENYCVATLSNADLFEDEISLYGVKILPIKYLDGKVYREESPNSAYLYHKFYEKLRNGNQPKLKTPQKKDYDEFFDNLIMSGYKRILYLATSSAISSDYATAKKSAIESMIKFRKSQIYVVDTLSTAMQKGILAITASKMKEEKSVEETFVEISQIAKNQCLFTVVYDFENISRSKNVKGGSVNGGTLVGIKPVLSINDNGELVLYKRCRGEKNAIANILSYAEKCGADKSSFYVYCADNTRNELFTIKMLQEKFPGCSIRVGKAGMINGLLYSPNAVFVGFSGKRLAYTPTKPNSKIYDDRFFSDDL